MRRIFGVVFAERYPSRRRAILDGIRVDVIRLKDLKTNKASAGRAKDLDDLEHVT